MWKWSKPIFFQGNRTRDFDALMRMKLADFCPQDQTDLGD